MNNNSMAIEQFGSLMRANVGLFEEAATAGALFRLYCALVRMWAKSGIAVRRSRKFLEESGRMVPCEALRGEYERIAATRDMLLALHEKRPASAPAPAYRIIARMLEDWDELAEDWAFAADPELDGLLEAFAAKL